MGDVAKVLALAKAKVNSAPSLPRSLSLIYRCMLIVAFPFFLSLHAPKKFTAQAAHAGRFAVWAIRADRVVFFATLQVAAEKVDDEEMKGGSAAAAAAASSPQAGDTKKVEGTGGGGGGGGHHLKILEVCIPSPPHDETLVGRGNAARPVALQVISPVCDRNISAIRHLHCRLIIPRSGNAERGKPAQVIEAVKRDEITQEKAVKEAEGRVEQLKKRLEEAVEGVK